jgi:hypothetical protein
VSLAEVLNLQPHSSQEKGHRFGHCVLWRTRLHRFWNSLLHFWQVNVGFSPLPSSTPLAGDSAILRCDSPDGPGCCPLTSTSMGVDVVGPSCTVEVTTAERCRANGTLSLSSLSSLKSPRSWRPVYRRICS